MEGDTLMLGSDRSNVHKDLETYNDGNVYESGAAAASSVASAPIADDNGDAQVRVLSFNFNVLPKGCGGFQNERIHNFLEYANEYDVLLFQEVYAASVLPYFVQEHVCFQSRLVAELKERGFSYYVISKQPSYSTILRDKVHSDNGLIIASRFPIGQCGSYTFKRNDWSKQSVRRGCLFAEVEVPSRVHGSVPILFFNVHLRPEDGIISATSQGVEIRHFIDSVIAHLYPEQDDTSRIPLVVAGDLNINGIDLMNKGQSTRKLSDFMDELQSLGGGLREIIFDTYGFHPPTRPSKLFFPTQAKFNQNLLTPQRQDYVFVNPAVNVSMARIRKFVTCSHCPYVYLSDHFGVSAMLSVSETERKLHQDRRVRGLLNSSVSEGIVQEHTNPLLSMNMKVIPSLIFVFAATYFGLSTLFVLGILWILSWCFLFRIHVVNTEKSLASVTSALFNGKENNLLRQQKGYDVLCGVNSLAEMWERTMCYHGSLPCLGRRNDAGLPEWLTYEVVDTKVRELGSGLCALGVAPGDVIGVTSHASKESVILELACALYGFTTMTLVGKGGSLRTLIDEHNVKVVFSCSSAVVSLLTCRSRSLETIVNMDSFLDSSDDFLARDVGIALFLYSELCYKGHLHVLAPPHVDGETAFSLVVDTTTTGELLKVVRITHADVLRNIRILAATFVLPVSEKKHVFVQFASFSAVFNRIFVLGLFAHGSSVATADVASSHIFKMFRPTIMVATSSLLASSITQLQRANERYGSVYQWLFQKVYQFRSVLINVHSRDSSVLRFLFFRSIGRQFGGQVEKIVLCESEQTVSCQLEEHIRVCYAPCLREVFFMPSEGVFCVDGVPAPDLKVELEPFDESAEKAMIGKLTLIRNDGEKHKLPIAATWNDGQTLRLMGSPSGILLPDNSQYVLAAHLEHIFAQSRYVNDIFLYSQPLRPIIAIVSPNRDTVEFEWLQQHPEHENNEESTVLNWAELARYASNLLIADFRRIVSANGLPVSHLPGFVHLHPHSFKDHVNFLTLYSGLRREYIAKYFNSVITAFYSELGSVNTLTSCLTFSSDEVFSAKDINEREFSLCVPMAIDIGGTFAKFIYVQPPGVFNPPDFLVHESSSLSNTLNMRTFEFFPEAQRSKTELNGSPSSLVGTIRFAKLPSKRIPDFVSYLSEIKWLDLYDSAYSKEVRATGGGAFKYAALTQKNLNVSFKVMREMDAVVQGLVLVIRLAPESIFTVDPSTGLHYPHKLRSPPGEALLPFPCLLVNIGSGISIIKCLGPDGSHVRVGGSPIGGATFWGLVRTMTNVTAWEEVIEIMRLDGPGDNKNVDLLVGDIYGFNAKDLPAMLSVDTVASTFGKLGTDRYYEVVEGKVNMSSILSNEGGDVLSPSSPKTLSTSSSFTKAKKPCAIDIVRSLLNMISSNVTQLAYLHARVQNVQNIFFAGGFVRNNPIIWSHISATLQYWSKGECHAHFLKHDGYLGALGSATMLSNPETE